MKNNTLAMLAIISLVISVGLVISYIDPAVCAGSQIEDLSTCSNTANQHIWGFLGFFLFGAITLVVGTIRNRIQLRRERDEQLIARYQK